MFLSWRSGDPRLWRVPIGGGEPIRLTEGAGGFSRFSRDGNSIFFVGRGERGGNVWTVPIDGGVERAVTDLSGRRGGIQSEALATDGEYLYFAWGEDLGDIWVMDVVTDEDSSSAARYLGSGGTRCPERHRLEFHHDEAYGLGGDRSATSIGLMCCAHNLYMAEMDFGKEKMDQYRRSAECVREPAPSFELRPDGAPHAPPTRRVHCPLVANLIL